MAAIEIGKTGLAGSGIRSDTGWWLIAVALLASGGCSSGDPVTVHESVVITRPAGSSRPPVTANQPDRYRMIAAIHERPDWTWFFKLTGSLESIEAEEAAWNRFLESVRFSGADPEWTLPEGWVQDEEQSGSIRFATLQTGTGPEAAELSVTRLGAGQPLGANVNRWRGQLGLPPIAEARLQETLQRHDRGPTEFVVYDARGPRLDTGMGRPPFAGGSPSGQPPVSDPAGPGTPNPPPHHAGIDPQAMPPAEKPDSLTFTAPAGWNAGTTSSFVAGRWSLDVDGQPLELSLLNMNPSDESWRMNVAAWSRQTGIEKEPDIEQITGETEVAGTTARQARLDGPPGKVGDPDSRSVTVVMFEDRQGNGWVVKLSGSRGAVDQHQDILQSFLDSIGFPPADEPQNESRAGESRAGESAGGVPVP